MERAVQKYSTAKSVHFKLNNDLFETYFIKKPEDEIPFSLTRDVFKKDDHEFVYEKKGKSNYKKQKFYVEFHFVKNEVTVPVQIHFPKIDFKNE